MNEYLIVILCFLPLAVYFYIQYLIGSPVFKRLKLSRKYVKEIQKDRTKGHTLKRALKNQYAD